MENLRILDSHMITREDLFWKYHIQGHIGTSTWETSDHLYGKYQNIHMGL